MLKIKTIKIIVDIAMTVLLIMQMAYIFLGQELHEWTGILLFVLFVIHHGLNINWIKNISKGRYSLRRMFLTVINSMIFLAMIGLITSGITMSQFAAQNLDLGLSMSIARKIHIVSSYSGYILMSIHIGLHLSFISRIKKIINKKNNNKAMDYVLKFTSIALVIYGLYSLVKHDLFSYVFLRKEFVFFNMSQPVVLFILDYIAIMGFWVIITKYFEKMLRKL